MQRLTLHRQTYPISGVSLGVLRNLVIESPEPLTIVLMLSPPMVVYSWDFEATNIAILMIMCGHYSSHFGNYSLFKKCGTYVYLSRWRASPLSNQIVFKEILSLCTCLGIQSEVLFVRLHHLSDINGWAVSTMKAWSLILIILRLFSTSSWYGIHNH